MAEATTFLRWLIVYAVSGQGFFGGFLHFAAVYLILVVIVRIAAFFRVNITITRSTPKTKGEA